jgi:hypothetical protein
MTQRGDQLLGRIRSGIGSDDDVNELLAELYKGHPVSSVQQLVNGDRDEAVKAGAWIISELGKLAAPLMVQVAFLLQHPLRSARFFALDAVLVNASAGHGRLIADAIGLIDDHDSAVRWKAIGFLSRATPQQLRAGLHETNSITIAALVKWLLDNDSTDHSGDIIARLDDPDPCRRRFAAAAAARIANQTTLPLDRAALTGDEEIRSFAQSWRRS